MNIRAEAHSSGRTAWVALYLPKEDTGLFGEKREECYCLELEREKAIELRDALLVAYPLEAKS